jgi:hypothetical protein
MPVVVVAELARDRQAPLVMAAAREAPARLLAQQAPQISAAVAVAGVTAVRIVLAAQAVPALLLFHTR